MSGALRGPEERHDLRLLAPAAGAWAAAAVVPTDARRWPLVAGLALVCALVCASRRVGRLAAASTLIAIAAAAVGTGLRVDSRGAGPLAALAAQRVPVDIRLVVTTDPHVVAVARGPALTVLTVRVEQVGAGGRAWSVRQPVLVLAHGSAWRDLLPSQRVQVSGRLQPPRPADDVAAVLTPAGAPARLGRPSLVQRSAATLRAGLRTAAGGLPGGADGLLPGLVDGDTGGLPATTAQSFRATGLTHLVAVSGTNVAAVLAAALALARGVRLPRRAGLVLAAVLLVGFVVLARPSPSVLRAMVMGLLGVLAALTGRERPVLPALSATVLVLVLVSPDLARSPGFALSVLASGALVLLAPTWRDSLVARGWSRRTAEVLCVPLAAQLVCAPVIVLLTPTVSLVAVPANLLAAPAVAPATLLGVVAAVLAPVLPAAAHLAAWAAALPCAWMVEVAHVGAGLPGAQVRWPGGTAGALLLVGVTVALLALLRRVVPPRAGAAM